MEVSDRDTYGGCDQISAVDGDAKNVAQEVKSLRKTQGRRGECMETLSSNASCLRPTARTAALIFRVQEI